MHVELFLSKQKRAILILLKQSCLGDEDEKDEDDKDEEEDEEVDENSEGDKYEID